MKMPLLKKLQIENKLLKEDINNLIPSIAGNGESLILNGTSNARFKKFIVSGNSKQDGEPSLENRAEINRLQKEIDEIKSKTTDEVQNDLEVVEATKNSKEGGVEKGMN